MKSYEGLITAMVTPLTADNRVNDENAVALARHLFATGSDGIVVAGSTGEAATLTDDERVELLALLVNEVGDHGPVIAGAGSNNTRHAVSLTERSVAAGADAILSVTPYYNKPNLQGLIRHYEEVAKAASGKPVILYNHPGRCAMNISPEGLARLAQIEGVEAVKQANDDELQPIDGLTVLTGNDEAIGGWLQRGGRGAISTASNIAGTIMKRMFTEPEACKEIDASLEDLYAALVITTNPIPVKAALKMLGHDVGGLRLPLVEANAEEMEQIEAVLIRHGLLQRAAIA